MSDAPNAGGSPANELQFDHVEYTAPAPAATCRVCGQPMQSVYYEVNGQPFCPDCHEQLEKSQSSGSKIGRFTRATLYGSLAGLAGAAIYYGVREITHYEIGLISVVVGLMIGKAVKTGSNARGGWLYQGLAMFLTYTAIVSTYIPPVIGLIRDRAAAENAAAANAEQPAKPDGAADAPAAVDVPADADARPDPAIATSLPGLVGQLLLVLAVLVGFAYAIPVLAGFESPMGLIIIAIGLYEAWSINRRIPLIVNGPYQIGRAGTGSGVDVEPAG